MDGNDVRLGKYRHFKGHLCNVIGVARHSETFEKLVIYTHPNEEGVDEMWARPVAMFLSNKRVDGKEVARFEFVGES